MITAIAASSSCESASGSTDTALTDAPGYIVKISNLDADTAVEDLAVRSFFRLRRVTSLILPDRRCARTLELLSTSRSSPMLYAWLRLARSHSAAKQKLGLPLWLWSALVEV